MMMRIRSFVGSIFPWLAAAVMALAACVPSTQTVQLSRPSQSTENSSVNTPVPALSQGAAPSVLPTISFNATPIPFPAATTFANPSNSGSPGVDCFVTAVEEGLRLNPAPFITEQQLLPTMEPNIPYQVVDMYPTYYHLARDGVPVGWIEYMTIGLSSRGEGCDDLFFRPPDTRSLTDFPGLCFFTVNRETETFSDSALTAPSAIILTPSSQPLVVLRKSQESILTSFGHAGPSFYVPADHASIFGDCEGIPTSAP